MTFSVSAYCVSHTHTFLPSSICVCRADLTNYTGTVVLYTSQRERTLSRDKQTKKKKKEVDDRRREKQRGTRMSSTHFAATLREEITNKTVPSSNSRENFALSLTPLVLITSDG